RVSHNAMSLGYINLIDHPLTLLLPSLPESSDLFVFNAPAPPYLYTLSLHDALPICTLDAFYEAHMDLISIHPVFNLYNDEWIEIDRKSTRLNSSHVSISYAVFCLKKKKITADPLQPHATRRPTQTNDYRRSAHASAQ